MMPKPARYIWPIGLLLILEAAMLMVVAQADGTLPPLTPLSVTASIFCLLFGLWPLLLHPSRITQLTAWASILLAGFIFIPTRPGIIASPPAGMVLWLIPAFLLYRLIHGVFFAAAAFHVAAYFPAQVATAHCPRPGQRAILLSYLGSLLTVVAFITIPFVALRVVAFAILLFWIYWLIGRGVWRLICLSRTPLPDAPIVAQQARILLISALLAAIPTLLLNALELLVGEALAPPDLAALFLVLFPLGVAYTILRHDLLTLDSTIRRTLAYTLLSALALLLYFSVTLLVTNRIVQRWPGLGNIVIVLSLLATAFAFAPMQQHVQGWVDRWLYPERRRFHQAITDARLALGTVIEHNAVIRLLTEQLPAQIDAQWATLTLAPAAIPTHFATPPAWNSLLIVGNVSLGHYWLGPRQTLLAYEADEQAALQQLLHEAALVLAYADTIGELQELNQALETRVTARTAQVITQQRALAAYAERQQLARNLHDSITQSLFSLNLSLRAIRKLAQRDPQAAFDQLLQQEDVAQQALTEMRELLVQLRSNEPHPHAPDIDQAVQVDLIQQLHQLCEDSRQQSGLQVTVQAPSAFFCSDLIATEIGFVVREALHNIVKHSGVQTAVCNLTRDNKAVHLTVRDEGQGFTPTRMVHPNVSVPSADQGKGSTAAISATTSRSAMTAHFGLQGMQERATAIGGRLEVQSVPGRGTTVMLHIPHAQLAGSASPGGSFPD